MTNKQTKQTPKKPEAEKGKRLNVYVLASLAKELDKQYKREATKHLKETCKPLSYSAFLSELIKKGLKPTV